MLEDHLEDEKAAHLQAKISLEVKEVFLGLLKTTVKK